MLTINIAQMFNSGLDDVQETVASQFEKCNFEITPNNDYHDLRIIVNSNDIDLIEDISNYIMKADVKGKLGVETVFTEEDTNIIYVYEHSP